MVLVRRTEEKREEAGGEERRGERKGAGRNLYR